MCVWYVRGTGGGCCGWDRMRWGRDGQRGHRGSRGTQPTRSEGIHKPIGWFGRGRPSACWVVNKLSRGRSGLDGDQLAVPPIRKQVTAAWARRVSGDLHSESRACRMSGVRESNQSDLSDWVNVLHLLKWGEWG